MLLYVIYVSYNNELNTNLLEMYKCIHLYSLKKNIFIAIFSNLIKCRLYTFFIIIIIYSHDFI